MNLRMRYLVDREGKKSAVVLSLKEFKKLLKALEDLEDALDLKEAIRTAQGFRNYSDIRKELKDEGKL